MKRTMKRGGAVLLAAMLIMAFFPAGAFAASSDNVEDVSYGGKGKVEIEFVRDVSYKNLSISVEDKSGKSYDADILEKDEEELELRIKDWKPGGNYTITIGKVKWRGSDYRDVTVKVSIPKQTAGNVTLKSVTYDKKDKEVEFDFLQKVRYKKLRVRILDSNGKNYVKRVDSKDARDLDVKTKKLKKGKTYTFRISGIRKSTSKEYTVIKGSFKA